MSYYAVLNVNEENYYGHDNLLNTFNLFHGLLQYIDKKKPRVTALIILSLFQVILQLHRLHAKFNFKTSRVTISMI